MTIETLQPAEVSISPEVKHAVMVNRYEQFHPGDSVTESQVNGPVADKMFNTVVEELRGSQRFDSITPVFVNIESSQAFSSGEINSICNKYDADLLISLESLEYYPQYRKAWCPVYGPKTDRSMRPPRIIGYKPCKKLIDVRMDYSFVLHYPEPGDKTLEIPVITSFEKLSPLYNQYGEMDDMTNRTATYAGFYFCDMISPIWIQENRFVYARGSSKLRKSAAMIKDQQIDEAISILKTIEHSARKKEIYRAKINLSYCYEVKDIIWKAKKYAMDAYRIEETDEVIALVNHLYQRILDQDKLNEQLGW